MAVKFYSKSKLNRIIKGKIKRSVSSIDIGCGIKPNNLLKTKQHICVEPFIEYVNLIKDLIPFERYIILNATWEKALILFPDKSIDNIIFSDVIEHLEKNDGIALINECERIAKKQIILFTPLGFMPQVIEEDKMDGWGMKGGSFQEHKSGWNLDDFDERWDIFCAKEYHFHDHEGNKFEKPYGAFWAIKNIPQTEKKITILNLFSYSLNKELRKILTNFTLFAKEIIPFQIKSSIKHFLLKYFNIKL